MRALRRLEGLAATASRLARFWPGGRAPAPLAAYLLLTYRCNQACDFCFLRERETGAAAIDLDPALTDRILAQLPRRTLVSFSGGEPLCHPYALDIIERTARKRRVSLVTNGTLLDTNRIERLLAAAPRGFGRSGLMFLGISLFEKSAPGAATPIAAAKIALLESLRAAREKNGRAWPLIDLKIVLQAENAAATGGYLELLRRGLADVLTFQLPNDLLYPPYYDGDGSAPEAASDWRRVLPPPSRSALGRERWEQSLRALIASPERAGGRVRFYPDIPVVEMARFLAGEPLWGRYRCAFPWTGVMISPRGNAFLCRNPTPENLAITSFREAWNGENFRRFRRAVRAENVAATCPGCCFLLT